MIDINEDAFNLFGEKFEIIREEVRRGHYFADTCQFHGDYRQFADLNLKYNHKYDQIQLDSDPDYQSLRVFEILRRVELSMTLDGYVSTKQISSEQAKKEKLKPG